MDFSSVPTDQRCNSSVESANSWLYLTFVATNSANHTFSYVMVFYLSTGVCNDGDIRLAGSAVPRQGRVEVCYREAWGTVCDNLWSTNDANVACRQLGFSRFGVCVCVRMCMCACVHACVISFFTYFICIVALQADLPLSSCMLLK